jgi:hypothetical protein
MKSSVEEEVMHISSLENNLWQSSDIEFFCQGRGYAHIMIIHTDKLQLLLSKLNRGTSLGDIWYIYVVPFSSWLAVSM